MKKLCYLLLINLMLIFVIGCSKQEPLEEPIQSGDVELKSAVYVPISGEFEVYIAEVIHPGPPPPKILKVLGEGMATHLGKSDVELIQKWWPPGPPPFVPPWQGKGIGDVTFTAANGDKLLAYYDDAVSNHLSYSLVTTTFTGYFVDGGTGRFETASGYFNWEVVFYPLENVGYATMNGEIMYSRNNP